VGLTKEVLILLQHRKVFITYAFKVKGDGVIPMKQNDCGIYDLEVFRAGRNGHIRLILKALV
jgi:hypothetical protein